VTLARRWSAALDDLRARDRFRSLSRPRGVDFTSNDYLGYGHAAAAVTDLPRSGLASRLLRGHHAIWERVEADLAAWHGTDAVLMMSSGYAANEGLLSTVLEPGDWIASDELNHASILDGLRLARPRKFVFRHNDLTHLEDGLKTEAGRAEPGRERFVIVESLYSIAGDTAPLRGVVELANRYGAHVIVDEAHSTGCFGLDGSGCVDAAGVRGRVLATVHTGGKALGVPGAYVVGSRLLKDYLLNRCRHLIFTTALPAACGQWWLDALERVRADNAGRAALHANAAQFRAALAESGVRPLGGHYVVPVVLGDDVAAVAAARRLQD
jgi:7-keto-8-aminopelargonate synthetase-like enzyme